MNRNSLEMLSHCQWICYKEVYEEGPEKEAHCQNHILPWVRVILHNIWELLSSGVSEILIYSVIITALLETLNSAAFYHYFIPLLKWDARYVYLKYWIKVKSCSRLSRCALLLRPWWMGSEGHPFPSYFWNLKCSCNFEDYKTHVRIQL